MYPACARGTIQAAKHGVIVSGVNPNLLGGGAKFYVEANWRTHISLPSIFCWGGRSPPYWIDATGGVASIVKDPF